MPSGYQRPPATPFAVTAGSAGCRWLLERWGELRRLLEAGLKWQGPDRFKAIRLLGRQPLDAAEDDRVCAQPQIIRAMRGRYARFFIEFNYFASAWTPVCGAR